MTDAGPPQQERVPTGIPGLDTVLNGGLIKGNAYMVMGMPGAGKTILANQACFHHVAQGGRVLYVTLLAEAHARLMANLRGFTFFDPSRIPDAVTYLSAYSALEEGGLDGLLDVIRREMKTQRASLLVLDGLVAAQEAAHSPRDLKKFIHGLQLVSGLVGCTTLLLTTSNSDRLNAEHTMVDGLLVLFDRVFGVRAVRELCVRKFRGSFHLRGRHSFEIVNDGIVVYPRLESILQQDPPPPPASLHQRQPFGIAKLDDMLEGGLVPGASTLLLGTPGSGKTLLGLHFLAEGARRGEKSHYFAFYDSPERVLAQARGVGLELEPLLERGTLELSYRPPTETLLDKLGAQLLSLIRERGVRRIFVDGYDALRKVSFRRTRAPRFLSALVNECRQRGVTLLCSVETRTAFGPEVTFPMRGVSMLAENIFFLRTVELSSELRRVIALLKIRQSGYEPTLRELVISKRGMKVGRVVSGQQLLTGLSLPAGRLLKRRGK